MSFPKVSQIEESIFQNGLLVLPASVRTGILSCLASSTSEITKAKDELCNAYKKNYSDPPDVRYETDAIIDAYTIDYLPRNFFIPRIALRDLAICEKVVKFNKTINILDIGSGTGAVSLGVFELFSKAPFSKFSINLLALDSSQKALERQSCILKKSHLLFKQDTFRYKPIDLKDIRKVSRVLDSHAPWDLIISANFMNELEFDYQKEIISLLPKYLSKNGSVIIAEPAVDRGKRILSSISKIALDIGLTIYYPCSEDSSCTKNKCWKWREYQIGPIKYARHDGIILFSDKPLLISVLILNKNRSTIYDSLKEIHRHLKWGIIAPNKDKYEVCSHTFDITPYKRYKRGSIVGWKEIEGKVIIEHYKEL